MQPVQWDLAPSPLKKHNLPRNLSPSELTWQRVLRYKDHCSFNNPHLMFMATTSIKCLVSVSHRHLVLRSSINLNPGQSCGEYTKMTRLRLCGVSPVAWKASVWIPAPLTLLFREMRSAVWRMASFLEIRSDLAVSRPPVNTSLRDVHAAERLALHSSVSEYPAANS